MIQIVVNGAEQRLAKPLAVVLSREASS